MNIPIEVVTIIALAIVCAATYPAWYETYSSGKQGKRKGKNNEQ